jgi:hypothetical protein
MTEGGWDVWRWVEQDIFRLMKDATQRALNRLAPERQREEFVRALRKAIRETEEERTRRGYSRKPDSETEADDWSTSEEWRS